MRFCCTSIHHNSVVLMGFGRQRPARGKSGLAKPAPPPRTSSTPLLAFGVVFLLWRLHAAARAPQHPATGAAAAVSAVADVLASEQRAFASLGRRAFPPAASHAQSHYTPGVQEQWAAFWVSDTPAALETLQSLRDQVSFTKLQQLHKDLEPQNTAGLDVALADSLQQLSQHTQLGAAQAWLQQQVTTEVFRVLDALQHPQDCNSARKLICHVNKRCGWGCQIHNAVHCFTNAVALNRTMVLKTNPWRYAPHANGTDAWHKLMTPVSSCTDHHLHNPNPPALTHGASLSNSFPNELEVFLDVIDDVQTEFEVPAMPPDVLQLVRLFSSRPETWWVGVLESYIMRPSAASLERHTAFKHNASWASPIVGVHIRLTDKIAYNEAKDHSVSQYLSFVERYCDLKLAPGWQQQYQQLHQGVHNKQTTSVPGPGRCSVYLATDEPEVLTEIQQSYPHINVITNPVALQTVGARTRNSEGGAQGIYDDVILLAATDYIVGTFSSQVSRLAHELALVNGSTPDIADRSLSYHSVDSMWYFGGQHHYEWCTKHDYTVEGKVVVPGGQHVDCPVIFGFESGRIKCTVLGAGTKEQIVLPPAIVGHCKTFIQHTYRNVLPHYMQRPPAAAASVEVAAAA